MFETTTLTSRLTRRPRRLRTNETIRDLVRETTLTPRKLVLPLFIIEGQERNEPIEAMPGRARLSIDLAVDECRRAVDLGVRAFALFGLRELAALVRKEHKYVVVVGAPCGRCGVAKVDALRPLLSCPKLACCWSHLVTDIGSAKLLLPESKTRRKPEYV